MSSFDLPNPEVFTAGAVGPPGQRVFYLQVRDEGLAITMKCEKQQVAALAEYFDGLLSDLEPAPFEVPSSDLDLAQPLQPIWTVGAIGVAYDEPADRIVVVLEEITEVDEDDEPAADDGASVRVRLSRGQVAAFVNHSRSLVAAGRPPCQFCGLPVDPDGHACPRMN